MNFQAAKNALPAAVVIILGILVALPCSATAAGPPPATTDDEYLDNVQNATFNYFWDYGHPTSGLARESYNLGHGPDLCASGAMGMGIISIVVGSSRNFASRSDAADRILKIVSFLEDTAERFRGAWPHWLNCTTGVTIPFSTTDDGADLVETSFVVQGLLVARQYFDSPEDPVELDIRDRSTRLWEEVEWNFFQSGDCIYWHWSPNYGLSNLALRGWMETQIVYILGVASPLLANRIPASLYQSCWTSPSNYANPTGSFYGIRQWVGPDFGGPLFWEHYSFLGMDPRNLLDGYCNYFKNSRNIGLIHQQHAIQNPNGHTGYSANSWGFTASFGPNGYGAWSPTNDQGVITPTAALSTMPFTPVESMLALKHFYDDLDADLWGPYGFVEAFHPGQGWYADGYLGIDQGTIAPMIENYRTGLCWDLFMKNIEILPALDAMGFIKDPLDNLLVNPGFEDGLPGSLLTVDIPGWTKFGGSNGWVHPDQGEQLGEHGLKLWDDTTGVSQSLAVEEGISYTFACYMATFAREGPLSNRAAVLSVDWYGGGGSFIQSDIVGSLTGSNSPDTWFLIESSLSAPLGATSAMVIAQNNKVEASLSSGGVTQFDAVSVVRLVPIQSSAPTVGPTASPSAPPSTAPTRGPTASPTISGYCSDNSGRCLIGDPSGCACFTPPPSGSRKLLLKGSRAQRAILLDRGQTRRKLSKKISTPKPTGSPTNVTPLPTDAPTKRPSRQPTSSPTEPVPCECSATAFPTGAPSNPPSKEPTRAPSDEPTESGGGGECGSSGQPCCSGSSKCNSNLTCVNSGGGSKTCQ